MTIRFEDEFYQLCDDDQISGARQFVYLLRKNPIGRSCVPEISEKPDGQVIVSAWYTKVV